MGPGCGDHRPRDRRRHAAREESRRVVAEIPNRELADEAPLYDRPHNVAPYRPAPMEAPEFSSRDLSADLLTIRRVGGCLLEALDLAAVRLHGSHQYDCGTGRRRGDCADQRNRHQCRDVARWQWPLLRALAARRRTADCRGMLPQSFDGRRAAGGRHQQSELRQSGAAGDHGAAGRSDRRNRRKRAGIFETPITGGNVSLYNETLGEAIWPTPVMGIVGLMKTAAPVTIPFKEEGRTVMLLGGPGLVRTRRGSAGRNTPRSCSTRCGDCRRRSTSIMKSGCKTAIREIVVGGPGGIGARFERRRAGRRAGRVLLRAVSARRLISRPVSMPNLRCFTKVRRGFWCRPRRRKKLNRSRESHKVEALRIGVTMKERLRI